MGRQPLGSGRRIDRAAMYAEAERLFARLGRAHRPAPPAAGPLHRRPADHRDRQGHLARRPAADHGRADRRAQRRRGRAAVRGRPQPARRGPRARLHLPPVRRGLRPLRHRDRDAGRRVHRRPARSPRPPSTQIVAAMVGREVADLFPKTPAEIGDPSSRSRASARTGVFHDVVFEVRAGEIVGPRRARRGRAQRDRPRGLRGRPLRVRLRTAQRQGRPEAQPARRDQGRAWRSSPRTDASRGWSSTPRSTRNVAGVIRKRAGQGRADHRRRGEQGRRPVGGRSSR